MTTFNAYIPMDRRFALASGAGLPSRARGAVLFADIRGFTPVTELLAEELGPGRGADELAGWLEQLFNAIIEPVNRYMGSVINLSGDAMLCWFDDAPPAAPPDLQNGARRATACALQIRAAMDRLEDFRTPTGGRIRLGIKVTVTGGDARRFLVGDPDIQVFEVLAGQLLDRSARVDHALKESEVAVGAEIIGHFGEEVQSAEWRTGEGGEHYRIITGLNPMPPDIPWPDQPAIPETLAQPFLLRQVYDRFKSGRSDFMSDLRPATTLFINFSGIDYDLDDAAETRLDALVRWVQSVLTRYEAVMLQITIGDKGSYIYAVSGAPVSHEDDSLRAVRAASDLLNPPEALKFMRDIRIGISRGIVYAGAYGGGDRQAFGAQGSEVNISARLMGMAEPGQILVTQKVAEGLRGRFETESLGQHQLKGVSNPIPVHLVRKYLGYSVPQSDTAATLVGRDRELSVLRSRMDDVMSGGAGTIVIEGEPGIGKSILLEQWVSEARHNKLPVYEGNGSAIEQTSAYFVWQPIFRRIFSIDEGRSIAEAQEVVLAQLRALGLENQAPLLNRVLTLNFPENDFTRQMDSEGRANSTIETLAGLLKHSFSTGPGVIVLDDCQYLDSASWALVRRARAILDNVLLVLAGRPNQGGDDLPADFRALLDDPATLFMEIGGLDHSQTGDLIKHRLKLTEVPRLLVDMIVETAEGHPFFSEEIAYALRDAGIIHVDRGRCRIQEGVTSLVDLDFPLTVQGVVTSRIDRLDGDKQLTLKTASVIGRIFAVQTLREIHPGEPADAGLVPDQLEAMNRLDLVQPEDLDPSLRYIFKHSITHGVVYQMMTLSQRKLLHRRAAEWYEAHFADNLRPYYPLLAYHWARTEEDGKAIDYLELAGEEAFANFANAEAVGFFKDALERDEALGHPNPVERRAQWELRCGEANVLWTRYTDGRQHLERGLALLGEPVPPSAGRTALGVFTALGKQTLHRAFPAAYLRSKADEKERLVSASRACQRLVEVYYHSGDLLGATYLTFKALNLAELAEESAELVEAYAGAGPFFYFIGSKGISEAHFKRAVHAYERSGSLRAYAYYLLVRCGNRIGEGDWEEGRRVCRSLIEAGEQLGSVRRQNDGRQHLMILETMYGDFRTAAALAEELLPAARQIQDARFEGYALHGLAYAALFQGDEETCHRMLEALERRYIDENAFTDEQFALNMYGLRCLYQARFGDVQACLQEGAQAEALMGGAFQASFFTLPGYLATAEAYFHLWENRVQPAAVEVRAKNVVAGLKRFARTFPIGRPAQALFTGRYQLLTGKPGAAAKTWLAALARWEGQMPYECSRMHIELGRHDLGLGEAERETHRRIGEEAVREMGLDFEGGLLKT